MCEDRIWDLGGEIGVTIRTIWGSGYCSGVKASSPTEISSVIRQGPCRGVRNMVGKRFGAEVSPR